MNITVFGANGKTGRQVVERALAAGHTVTAFVRDPAKAPQVAPGAQDRLRVVIGDALDATAVARAVAEADAVVSALGTSARRATNVLGRCMTNITTEVARNRADVPIIGVGTVGAGESVAQMSQPLKSLLRIALRNAIRDHESAESAMLACPNPTLVVRCVGLTDGPATGYTASGVDPVRGGRISRSDVADFIVKILNEHPTLAGVPGAVRRAGATNAWAVSLW